MIQRQWNRLLILCIVLAISPVTGARMQQGRDTPPIVVGKKAVYRLTGGQLQRLNLTGSLFQNVTLSPDGRLLAYQAVPPTISASVDQAPVEKLPFDIHLYDLISNRDIAIFEQGKTPAQLRRGEAFFSLSVPQWSPDGKQVAWAKLWVPSHDQTDTLEIDIYDVDSRKVVSSLDTGLKTELEDTPLQLAWSATGLSLVFSATNIATFSRDEKEIGRVSLDNAILALLPVRQNGRDYVGALDSRYVLHLIEPQTGASSLGGGGLERYSLNAPDTSLSVIPERRPDHVVKWRLVRSNGSPEPLATRISDGEPLPFSSLAISPAGDQLAYVADEAAFVWKDGKATQIKGTGAKGVKVQAVVWSPPAWRVQRASSNGLTIMSADTKSKLTDAPLLLKIKGDLYAWTKADKSPQQLTHRGDVSAAVVSPDGRWAVYRTSPSRLGPGTFRTYSDVWLLDIASRQAREIVSGPAPDQRDTVRVSPTWSPDSQKIAWIELTWPGLDHRIVSYDIANNTSTISVTGLPSPRDMFQTHLAWDRPGLVIAWETSKGGEARMYSSNGILLSKTDLGLGILYPVWLTDGEKHYAGIVGFESLVLIDPRTGTKRQAARAFELYSPNAPDKGLTVFYDQTLGDGLDNWRVRLPDGEIDIILPVGGTQAELALSPTGQELAYGQYGVAFVYRDGEVLPVPPTGNEEPGLWPSAAWGPISFRLHKEKAGTGTQSP